MIRTSLGPLGGPEPCQLQKPIGPEISKDVFGECSQDPDLRLLRLQERRGANRRRIAIHMGVVRIAIMDRSITKFIRKRFR